MANHLTPTELAREAGMERREVITKCMEMGVPIFQGQDRQDPLPGFDQDRQVRGRRPRSPRPEALSIRRGLTAPGGVRAIRAWIGWDRFERRALPRAPLRNEGEEERLMEVRRRDRARGGDWVVEPCGPAATGRQEARRPAPRSATRTRRRRVAATSPTRSSARSSRRSRSACRTSASSRGDKVAILAHTRPEWTYSDFAILCAGATVGADLPDQLARGVPVRARPLRVARR